MNMKADFDREGVSIKRRAEVEISFLPVSSDGHWGKKVGETLQIGQTAAKTGRAIAICSPAASWPQSAWWVAVCSQPPARTEQ